MEFPGDEVEKTSGRTDEEEDEEADFGHIELKIPIRHQRGNVRHASICTNLGLGKEAYTEAVS